MKKSIEIKEYKSGFNLGIFTFLIWLCFCLEMSTKDKDIIDVLDTEGHILSIIKNKWSLS